MDLTTIQSLARPTTRAEIPPTQPGDAYLAGGTYIFSEPQRHLRRLIDLQSLNWPPIEHTPEGITLAATCSFAQLYNADLPQSPLIHQICESLWGSFKIWNSATIGGNLCLALPASPIAAFANAMHATLTLWLPNGTTQTLPAANFILAPEKTALPSGAVLRSLFIKHELLQHQFALRQISLTAEGRSATLLIGRKHATELTLTITAATPKPVQLTIPPTATTTALNSLIDQQVEKSAGWYNDKHGLPAWRRHTTHLFAAQIREELGQ